MVLDVDAFAVIVVECLLGLPLRTLRCAELSFHPFLDVVLTYAYLYAFRSVGSEESRVGSGGCLRCILPFRS